MDSKKPFNDEDRVWLSSRYYWYKYVTMEKDIYIVKKLNFIFISYKMPSASSLKVEMFCNEVSGDPVDPIAHFFPD